MALSDIFNVDSSVVGMLAALALFVALVVYALVKFSVAGEEEVEHDYEPSEGTYLSDGETFGPESEDETGMDDEMPPPLVASVDDQKPIDMGQSAIRVEVAVPEEVVDYVNEPVEVYNEQMAEMNRARNKYVADQPTMDDVARNSRLLAGQVLSDSLNAFSDPYFKFNVQHA